VPPTSVLPALSTPRLVLRARAIEDHAACLAMDSDPEVMRHVGGLWPSAEDHRRAFLERTAQAYPAGLGYWSVFPRGEPGRFLGWVVLIPHAEDPAWAEIGWRLVRAEWGRGHAREAAAAVLRHGFEAAGARRIVADIHPDNERSMRVARAIGLEDAGDAAYLGEPCRRFAAERVP
jgi:RimJ/RimL family protein N-acetyltransferase